MGWVELICCAVSSKEGAWCVAGWRIDGGGWCRPVSAATNGALSAAQCRLSNWQWLRTLDVVRVPLAAPAPRAHQPENWLVAAGQWEFVRRPGAADFRSLWQAVQPGPLVLGSADKAWTAEQVAARPLAASLALIDVSHATVDRWAAGTSEKVSLRFALQGQFHELPVHDVTARRRALGLEHGEHPLAALGVPLGAPVLALVSVTELYPRTGRHHKLIPTLLVAGGDGLATLAEARDYR